MEISKIDKASKYLEASKINQENLWKRRQIEWKSSFSLWTAIALFSGFIYTYSKPPITQPCIFLIIIAAIYITAIFLHCRHLKAITLSNEKDMDFINYFLSKATWELDNADFTEKPKRPNWAGKDMTKKNEDDFYNNRKYKMRHYILPVFITGLIAFLSLCILFLRFTEN